MSVTCHVLRLMDLDNYCLSLQYIKVFGKSEEEKFHNLLRMKMLAIIHSITQQTRDTNIEISSDYLDKIKRLATTLTRVRAERDASLEQNRHLKIELKQMRDEITMLTIRAENAERREIKIARRSKRAIDGLTGKLFEAQKSIKDWEHKYQVLSGSTDGALRHQLELHESETRRLRERLQDLELWYKRRTKDGLEATIIPDEKTDERKLNRHGSNYI
jgi:regulator of replication initiation timing